MKKRGRPAKKTLQEKIEAVSQEVVTAPVEIAAVEASTETVQQKRPDPSNRTGRRRVSAVGGAGSGGKLGIIGDLDPAYHYRICNDEGSNIQEMESFGYDVVTSDEVSFKSSNEISTGSQHSVVVDKSNGLKGILMRQPIEYQNEDRKARADMISKGEESMFRNLKTEDGRYGDIETGGGMSKKVDN